MSADIVDKLNKYDKLILRRNIRSEPFVVKNKKNTFRSHTDF